MIKEDLPNEIQKELDDLWNSISDDITKRVKQLAEATDRIGELEDQNEELSDKLTDAEDIIDQLNTEKGD